MSRAGGAGDRLHVLVWALTVVRAADRRGTVLSGMLQLAGAIGALGVVWSSKLAIESVSNPQASTSGLVVGLGILVVAIALTQGIVPMQQLHQRLLGERVSQRVWRDLMRTSVSVGLDFWQRADFMGRLSRVSENSLYRPSQVVQSLFALTGAIVTAAGLITGLLLLEPLLVPILLGAGVPAVYISRRVSRIEFEFVVDVTPVRRRTMYLKRLMTQRDEAAELRAFGTAPFLLGRHDQGDREFLGALRSHVLRRLKLALIGAFASVLTLAATFGFIGALLLSGRMDVPTAGAAAIAARLLAGQLATVFASVGTLVECGPFLRDLREFSGLHDAEGLDRGQRRTLERGLTLRRLTFTYENSDRPALDDVSVEVPAGKIVMLVGENGSGKTTLAKIASGLFDPDEGVRSWDGDETIPPKDLRASVAVLFQDFVRYQMSARDNIAIARAGEVDEGAIREAARRANVADTIEGLPEGYDTQLGLELAQGADLSGGQWQRLALARAFYRDSPLVVLDEPTAALDPRAEWQLFEDVRAVLEGRSALLISHRYSSAKLADYVYVMHEGRVVEEGTHAELMDLDGRYAELYRLQASAYFDDESVD